MNKHSQKDWAQAVKDLHDKQNSYVLVTLLGASGSTPRSNGTKMVVCETRSYGTIGGGHLEYKATEMALEMLTQPTDQQSIEYFPLGPGLGQCCGGSHTVLFESFILNKFNIMLFGAGHVGSALSPILAQLPCKMHWVDSRESMLPEQLASNIRSVFSEDPVAEVGSMPAGSDYLIMTHNHQLDYDILEAVLKREDARYVGLIGSETKWRRFKMRMEHKGYDESFYADVHCPIGLQAVPGKRPVEVAVSIAGELIALNHQYESKQKAHGGISRADARKAMEILQFESDESDPTAQSSGSTESTAEVKTP